MRNIRKDGLIYMWSGPHATGTTDNTISSLSIVSPATGARIYAWGCVTTAAGTGALDPVLSLVDDGASDTTGAYGGRLAGTLTYNLDGAAATTISAFGAAGPGEIGAYGKSTGVIGDTMDIRVNYTAAADTFATTAASFNVWTLWAM